MTAPSPSTSTSAPAPAVAASVPAQSSAPAADPTMLVNVLDDFSLGPSSTQPLSEGLTPGAEEGFMKFLFKNNGVLFENDVLQIGIKSDYKKNLGK